MGVYILLIALLSPASSAVSKGSLFIGGSISFSSYGGGYYKRGHESNIKVLELEPMFEYFFIKRTAFGIGIYLKREVQDEYKLTAFDIGPHYTYYVPISSRNFIFIRGSLHLMEFTLNYSHVLEPYEESGTFYSLELGWGDLLTPHLPLTISVIYRYLKMSKGVSSDNDTGYIIRLRIGMGGFLYREI